MSFDADTFLQSQITDALDTKRIPVPVGEYTASIKSVGGREGKSKKGDTFTMMSIVWEVDDPTGEVAKATGRDKSITTTQDIFLDLNPSGGIATGTGKNIGLGRLREAVGQNTKGEPWSPTMLIGAVAKIKVDHRPDSNDPELVYDFVATVAKL